MSRVSSVGIIAAVGLATGIALFSLTAGHVTLETISPPPCPQLNRDPAAFDPLTGLPYGYTFVCGGAGGSTFHQPITAQQAIPVPLGFLLGAAAAWSAIVVSGRPRRPTRSGDIPGH